MNSLLKLKAKRSKSDGAPDLDKDPPVFKNGGSLRDYQREVFFFDAGGGGRGCVYSLSSGVAYSIVVFALFV